MHDMNIGVRVKKNGTAKKHPYRWRLSPHGAGKTFLSVFLGKF